MKQALKREERIAMPYKLLIADDERDITDMLASYFRRRGCDVLTAYGGEEAIALSAREPDLILLDIQMAQMDGIETLRKIRSKKDQEDIPVIMLTGVEDKDFVLESIKLGACIGKRQIGNPGLYSKAV